MVFQWSFAQNSVPPQKYNILQKSDSRPEIGGPSEMRGTGAYSLRVRGPPFGRLVGRRKRADTIKTKVKSTSAGRGSLRSPTPNSKSVEKLMVFQWFCKAASFRKPLKNNGF